MTLTTNNRRMLIVSVVTLLLMVPFVAMQFTSEVNWTPADFIIAGVLLFGTGLLCEIVLTNVKTLWSRLAICGLVLVMLFLVWAELAVGIFGTPFAGS
jgi:hypothetical protein